MAMTILRILGVAFGLLLIWGTLLNFKKQITTQYTGDPALSSMTARVLAHVTLFLVGLWLVLRSLGLW